MDVKIAMLGPIAWRTPPRHYGPWEQVTSLLTEGLVRRGVDVTLFATADSVTTARLESIADHGYAEDPGMDGRVWEALHVGHAMEVSGDFDLVHNQLDWLPLAFSRFVGCADGDDHPWILGLRHPARVHACEVCVRIHLRLRPVVRSSSTSRLSTTELTRVNSRQLRRPVMTWSYSDASIPTKARPRR